MHFTCLVFSIESKNLPNLSFPDQKKTFLSHLSVLKARKNISQTFQLWGVGNVEGGLFNEVSSPQALFWQTLLRLLCHLSIPLSNLLLSFQHDFTDVRDALSYGPFLWALSFAVLNLRSSPRLPAARCSLYSRTCPNGTTAACVWSLVVPVCVSCRSFFSQDLTGKCKPLPWRKPSSTQLGSLLHQLSCSNPSWVSLEMNPHASSTDCSIVRKAKDVETWACIHSYSVSPA